MKKNILIVASGTGGHVIPAKNISEKLAQRGYSVTWIGTKSGIENLILKDESYKIIYIKIKNIREGIPNFTEISKYSLCR